MTERATSSIKNLLKLSLALVAIALVAYSVGMVKIYEATCAPAVGGTWAPLGIALMLVAFGMHLSHAILKQEAGAWIGAVFVLLLAGAASFLLYVIAVVRCSGI